MASEVESELVWGDDEKNCELRLVWVPVIVSEFVSETSSVLLMAAVSGDENRPLDETLCGVDPVERCVQGV